jgi:hypothetical protein
MTGFYQGRVVETGYPDKAIETRQSLGTELPRMRNGLGKAAGDKINGDTADQDESMSN